MNTVMERKTPLVHDLDRWVDGEHGRFWGACGAAGMLIENQRSEILLQLRASWCHHGGTWGIPGGARMAEESPIAAAMRETDEEHGLPLNGIRIRDTHSLDYGYWSYVTVLASFEGNWTPQLRTAEADLARWVPVDEVAELQLHPGFSASWPQLRHRLAEFREGR